MVVMMASVLVFGKLCVERADGKDDVERTEPDTVF